MKKLLLITIIAFMFFNARAQKLEITLYANSTLSHFKGNSTVSDGTIQEGYSGPDSNYTLNPYGKKYSIGFNIGGQAQIVTKTGFIAGAGVGYELLRSRVNITSIAPAIYFTTWLPYVNYALYYISPATGSVTLNSTFINLSPYIGYRIKLKDLSFDLLPGAEFAITTSIREKGDAITTTRDYPTNYPRKKIPVDTRLKFEVHANYQNISINFGYARGTSNYNKDIRYPEPVDIKSELFRLGVGYRVL